MKTYIPYALLFVFQFCVWSVYNWMTSDPYKEAMVEYECRYNPIRVASVAALGDYHPCSRYIDQYRWAETQGVGTIPDGHLGCQLSARDSDRELECSKGLASQVRSVPHREGRKWNHFSPTEMIGLLNFYDVPRRANEIE